MSRHITGQDVARDGDGSGRLASVPEVAMPQRFAPDRAHRPTRQADGGYPALVHSSRVSCMRYPPPSTVWTISGLAGSASTLRRRFLTCESMVRS